MSAEKRVVKTIATLINKKVDFKFIPESFEQIIFEGVTARLLDFVMETLNVSPETVELIAGTAALSAQGANTPQLRELLAAKINSLLDLPLLTEDDEQKLLEAFLEVLVPTLSEGNSIEILDT